ncbi:hypothetical protein LCGC14_1833910 [marine sediment metagenome]|uniref:Uncharacterized protein n=1 Tax=marine sediment metagenome TaxID=412755 RepID=A0A0F9GFF1_9ZZZZ
MVEKVIHPNLGKGLRLLVFFLLFCFITIAHVLLVVLGVALFLPSLGWSWEVVKKYNKWYENNSIVNWIDGRE